MPSLSLVIVNTLSVEPLNGVLAASTQGLAHLGAVQRSTLSFSSSLGLSPTHVTRHQHVHSTPALAVGKGSRTDLIGCAILRMRGFVASPPLKSILSVNSPVLSAKRS